MARKTRIIATGALAALLIGTASAQLGVPEFRGVRSHAPSENANGARGVLARGAPAGFGAFGLRGGRGAPFGFAHAALGTEFSVRLYEEEPLEDVEPLEALTLTVGEDSEIAFADALEAARENAMWMVIETSEQSRSIDLPDADSAEDSSPRAQPGLKRGFALRGLARGSWQPGDTVTVVFFDGDPDAGGGELETLSFTYGEDSAVGFRAEFAEAVQEADWVVVTTPPRTQTIDLSKPEASAEGFAKPRNVERSRPGPGFGRR